MLTVTGLLLSPLAPSISAVAPTPAAPSPTPAQTREPIVQDLLRTTGQKGLTRRILQRTGAWELLPHPSTLAETATALAGIATHDLRQEQQRVLEHRARFRLHTRSAKQAQAQLAQLVQRWAMLPAAADP